ncbi:MAG: EamA family transporter [Acidobacteria bacterium]|nr:EamA family transporter [Acidobacteriota bacterium]
MAICVIWGTTYLAIKIALETMPPLLIGGIRYLIAGSVLIAWLRLRGERLPPLTQWRPFIVLGFLMLMLGNGGVVWAEQYVPSGLTAVILATTPFWMVGIESLFPGGDRVTLRHGIGLSVAFLGILVLVGPDILLHGGGLSWRFLAGVLALQVACAGWSVGSSYGKRLQGGVPPMTTAALQMLWGGIWMTLGATVAGEWSALHFTARSASAVLYLAFVGGLAGFGAYIYALAHLPVSLVSLYAYVNPIIAVALGSLVLGEPFNLRIALAIAIILTGMTIVPNRH